MEQIVPQIMLQPVTQILTQAVAKILIISNKHCLLNYCNNLFQNYE